MNKLILFASILFLGSLNGEINEIHEIESVKNYVSSDSVVFLNVGDTLFAPSSMLSDYQFREYFVERANVLLDKQKAESLINEIKAVIVEKIPKVTPEKVTPLVVKELQDASIPVLGYSGRFFRTAYAPNNGEIVHNHLQAMRIDLTRILIPEYENEDYVFKYGILFTNKKAPGPAIADFFAQMSDKPARLIVVDDSIKDLTSVEDNIKDIDIVLLRYNSVDARKQMFDPEIASLEFFEYFQNGRLITDEEAIQIKQSNNTNYKEMLDNWILSH